MSSPFDARPLVVAIAGSNGAGKTTFYEAHLAPAGLRFVNADDLARELEVDAYEAAEIAGTLRETLLEQGESFVFETVFSDPVGEKVAFLERAAVSEERVSMRNLARAVRDLPNVLVFDNGDLGRPFRMVARFERGAMVEKNAPVPRWVPRGR